MKRTGVYALALICIAAGLLGTGVLASIAWAAGSQPSHLPPVSPQPQIKAVGQEKAAAPAAMPVSAPSPVMSEAEAFRASIQNLKNMRDPFKRPSLEGPGWQEDQPKSELERIPTSELTMVGVLTGPNKTRALLRGPSGAVYPVSDGTKVGNQNGYVRKVLPDRVIVNEVVQDLLGEQEVVTSELRLNSKGVEKGVSSVHPTAALPPVPTGGGESRASWSSQSEAPAAAVNKPKKSSSPDMPQFTISLPPPVAVPKVGIDSVQTSYSGSK